MTIDDNAVELSLGIGWYKRTYLISKIKEVKVIRIYPFAGMGIRFLGNGYLYTISQGKAIELSFLNRTEIIQIGLDRAEEVKQAILNKMEHCSE